MSPHEIPDAQTDAEGDKKPYVTPALTKLGGVDELTQTGSGSLTDIGGLGSR